MKKTKSCLVIAFILTGIMIFALIGGGSNNVASAVATDCYDVAANLTYETSDNKGYAAQYAERNKMSFNSNSIGTLSISNVNLEKDYKETKAYSVKGNNSVSINYNLKYAKTKINNTNWYLSNDSATKLNNVNLNSSIKKGAAVLKKKNLLNSAYEVVYKETDVFETKNNIQINSLDGKDINEGSFYQLDIGYEICSTYKYTTGWWIFKKTKTGYNYKNCLEQYNFFIGKNDTKIQFLNLTETDYKPYTNETLSVEQIKKGDTLQNNSVTSSGFQLDFDANKSVGVTYRKNGANAVKVNSGVVLKENGKYDIEVTTLFNKKQTTTIYVYNGGLDKGYATYFGGDIFDGKRIADLESPLPVYQTGVNLNFNGVGNNIPALEGMLQNNTTNIETKIDASNTKKVITIDKQGVYFLTLTNSNSNVSGTYYQYNFAFIVSNKSTFPYFNKDLVLHNSNVQNFESKYIKVEYVMENGNKAYVCFDKDSYANAYDFAYNLEKKYIKKVNGGYDYQGIIYYDNTELVGKINETIDNKIIYDYINVALDNYYFDNETISNVKYLEDLDLENDIYLSTEVEITKMKNNQNIVTSNFKFVQTGDYETKYITARNIETNQKIELQYNTPISKMIFESGEYEITETNKYNESITYNIIYLTQNMSKLSLRADDQIIVVYNSNYQVVNAGNVQLLNVVNDYDSEGIISIYNLDNNTLDIYANDEIENVTLSNSSYLITLIDRSGNVVNVILNTDETHINDLSVAVDGIKGLNENLYNYLMSKDMSANINVYESVKQGG